MCPGEDCSAAAALSLFSYFSLEHQRDFDVRWLKGSATELIFEPWRKRLESMGAEIINEKKVSKILVDESDSDKVTRIETADGAVYSDIDVVVSCTGINAAQAIIRNNPVLSSRPDFAKILRLKAVDVVAVRMWLSRDVVMPYASNVGGNNLAPGLEATGCTFYDLTALQGLYTVPAAKSKEQGEEQSSATVATSPKLLKADESVLTTTAKSSSSSSSSSREMSTMMRSAADVDEGSNERIARGRGSGSVIEVDFYYAKTLVGQDSETVLQQALTTLQTADPKTFSALRRQDVEDFAVVRIPNAVSQFSPGSFESLPSIRTSVGNFYFAGDWVDRAGHKSWSQEKSLVTGYQAASIVLSKLFDREIAGKVPEVIDVEESEPHVRLGRAVVTAVRKRVSKLLWI
jgi:uncharacterized protein with NAD-binding domain and iron-sulfur cluster